MPKRNLLGEGTCAPVRDTRGSLAVRHDYLKCFYKLIVDGKNVGVQQDAFEKYETKASADRQRSLRLCFSSVVKMHHGKGHLMWFAACHRFICLWTRFSAAQPCIRVYKETSGS
eukprot:gnl/MRDRNA2_/MRDRNA2_53725_c0_seq1.p1 gnl/MRDRNA2_/MRDRNA2_53725_c0~~gnl/MRDRNA2_/MRDRNA2_53725_c0_seq1.p1  ORF type:complete len:114 (+),score=14.90 gnl/MRDRNA2_/MRDRNA2_53725_c0_seq1:311-652(+)